LNAELFPFRAEATFHLRMGDVEIDNEGNDEEQNTRRQDNGTLEKHKGKGEAPYQLKSRVSTTSRIDAAQRGVALFENRP
jgi:hypothetical protein